MPQSSLLQGESSHSQKYATPQGSINYLNSRVNTQQSTALVTTVVTIKHFRGGGAGKAEASPAAIQYEQAGNREARQPAHTSLCPGG